MTRASFKSAFEHYLYSENREGSGRVSSYLKALYWLQEMLKIESYGFDEMLDIWSVNDMDRFIELRERVLEEQKKGADSPWLGKDISMSYLRDYHCSAALTQLIVFLTQHQHTQKVIRIFKAHDGDASELAAQLDIDPEIPKTYVHDPNSKDGKDRIRETKERIGQWAFREIILQIYQNRCCLTGLDLPQINRASHIIGWAERNETRMDPRNGLCLSATYDAAFDRKLITFDDDYRLLLSKTIREHLPSESLQSYFLNREGQRIKEPDRHGPLREYLETHRKGGDF